MSHFPFKALFLFEILLLTYVVMEYLEYRISQLRSWKQGNLFIGAVESRPRFLSKV